MDENKNNGELFGFDSTEEKKEPASENNGYTVTPEGSYSYTETNNTEKAQQNVADDANNNEPSVYETRDDGNYGYEQKRFNNSYSEGPSTPFVFKTVPEKPKKVREKKSFSISSVVSLVIVAAIIGGLTGVGGMYFTSRFFGGNNSNQPQVNVTSPGNVNIDVSNLDMTVVEAVATKVTPSVVGIRTTVSSYNFLYGEQESSGEGSGVIYTADGYIITNYHVIQQAAENRGESSKIKVFLSYGDQEDGYDAAIVGYNISCDLAVIKINATGLTPVTLADSEDLNVGQFVVAIGNPGGLQFMGSVTYGVISGLNRIISDTGLGSGVELIQTDAAINPGNSGGALVNTKGELVGINSSKLVSESYEGMGFAIPVNATKEICDKIISKENDPDPFLGVTINERYTPEVLKQYGYPSGAVVYSVVPGSPAEDAGITKNDIITEINGVEIKDYSTIGDAIASCSPGQKISVKIYRNKRSYTLEVTLGSNNSQ